MAFLKLQDIGKIYMSADNASVGIRKVNLSFEKGEFVAVTGKSGSGKTTLLNVIGGLDSFEEGELYIEGRSTSHYAKADWDEYVSKYISFIFQDYNILESFTVLENIEFALTSIKDLKERKQRALDIAKKVGLEGRLKTKGVKLSGGEKQRTVIARAIAKDSPIILADEPTGNLDSANAKSIMALLKEISEDKLIIVVTHNYEDIKEYATRHIRIFDGGVESDEVFQKAESVEYYKESDDKYEKEKQYVFKKRLKRENYSKKERLSDFRDKIVLGWKRYSTRPKQNILISLILFIALSGIILAISMVSNMKFYTSVMRVNALEGRVMVAASTSSGYTYEDADELCKKYGAEYYIMHDTYLDIQAQYVKPDQDVNFPSSITMELTVGKKVNKGRLPSRPDEVALKVPYNLANDYSLGEKIILLDEIAGVRGSNQGMEYTVVGIDLYVDNRQPVGIYLTPEGYDYYTRLIRLGLPNLSGYVYNIEGREQDTSSSDDWFLSGYKIPYRDEYVSLRIDYNLKGKVAQTNARIRDWQGIRVTGGRQTWFTFEDLEYNADLKPVVSKLFSRSSIVISLSPELFNELTTQNSQQVSLMFENDKQADKAIEKMTKDGYSVLKAADINAMSDLTIQQKFINFISTTLISIVFSVTISLVVVVTLMKLMTIGKKDISVFRTMGISDSVVKSSTYVQLMIALIPAIILSVAFILFLYMAPFGVVISFIGWSGVIMIMLGMLTILLILAASYNRLIYRNKIKKGLRRANK